MSTTFNNLFIIFCIFVLNLSKQWKITNAAAVNYNDYNYVDTVDKDIQDYLENLELINKKETSNDIKRVNAEKRNIFELNNNDDNYPAECKPPLEVTNAESTSCTSTTTSSPNSNQCSGNSEADAAKETHDVINLITHLIKSMREHAIGLIKNMNELETAILATSSSDLNDLMANKNMTSSDMENRANTEQNPNSEMPGYVINEWAAPVKIDIVPGEKQTNEFMEEAQEAVRSWKQQIETCKRILDNAVRKALENSNIKSNIISETIARPGIKYAHSNADEVSGQQKLTELKSNFPGISYSNQASRLTTVDQPASENFKEVRSNGPRKYNGLYDTLHGRNGG